MEKIHFIGIGGIGMSGLATVALAEGNTVTGSDLEGNDLTKQLEHKGATVYMGHSAENIAADVTLAIRSACIRDDNPEVLKAKERGIPVILRGEYLKQVMEKSPVSVSVTGTHGKTTTSALLAHIMENCGMDPTAIIGGELDCFRGNAKYGSGNTVVAEVDESDGSFSGVSSTHALITNIEREHIDHYGSFENLKDAYSRFIRNISPEGMFFFNGEDPVLKELVSGTEAKTVSFGIDGEFDVTCRNCEYAKFVEFDLVLCGESRGRIRSSLVGRHNAMNILGAAAVGVHLGLDIENVADAVNSFKGVKRRFDRVGKVGTIEVIEDYAHHPTELESVIKAARDYGEGRVVTVFQPHRYSRTLDLAQEFTGCFYDADVLILTDVYSAFEDSVTGEGIKGIYEKIDSSRFEALDFMEKSRIPDYVAEIVRENDIVLVLGAGDIREISGRIVEKIKERTAGEI